MCRQADFSLVQLILISFCRELQEGREIAEGCLPSLSTDRSLPSAKQPCWARHNAYVLFISLSCLWPVLVYRYQGREKGRVQILELSVPMALIDWPQRIWTITFSTQLTFKRLRDESHAKQIG